MIKILPLALPMCLLFVSCAEKPEPKADPAALEKLLYSQEQAVEERVARTGRVIEAVQKVPLERVDPKVAVALVR